MAHLACTYAEELGQTEEEAMMAERAQRARRKRKMRSGTMFVVDEKGNVRD